MFLEKEQGCICPPRLPVCQCNNQPLVKVLTRKGIKAQAAEVEQNVRSRSAVLRAVERC
jgi:16S rRNA (cytosine1402-N4)-methyltransferase